jgi:hypothetical protein
MPLYFIYVPFLEYNLLLCYELQERWKKISVKNSKDVQGKWWESLEISWASMVVVFILLRGLVSFVGNFQAIYFGRKYQWCHWSSRENGDLKALVGYGNQMLQMFSPILFFVWLAKWRICWKWGLVRHFVVVVTNELPHSCPVGSWEEIKSDMIHWSPLSLCCNLK